MTTSTSYPRNGAAPATPARPSEPSSATWAVHEAPTSCCMRWHIGTMEMTYTMRGADEAEGAGAAPARPALAAHGRHQPRE